MKEFKIINKTLGQLLDNQAELYPDNDAIVYADRNLRLSYKQYNEEVNKFAKGLMALGIKKGDHVAVWAQNVPHWLIFMFSLAKIGAVLLTVNTGYKNRELEYVLQQSDSVALALTGGLKENDFLHFKN